MDQDTGDRLDASLVRASHWVELYDNSQSVAFLKVVKPSPRSSGNLDDGLLDLGKRLRIMENRAPRMPRTPQAARKRIREGMDYIDVN